MEAKEEHAACSLCGVAGEGYALDALARLDDARVDGGGSSGETDHRKHHIRRRERNREREHPCTPARQED